MSFSARDYLAVVQSTPFGPGDWTDTDATELGPVLRTDPMVKALSLVLTEARDMMDTFRSIELMDEKGRGDAVKLQGVLEGIERVVQRLVDLADCEEK